jgi:hypothetical protein
VAGGETPSGHRSSHTMVQGWSFLFGCMEKPVFDTSRPQSARRN